MSVIAGELNMVEARLWRPLGPLGPLAPLIPPPAAAVPGNAVNNVPPRPTVSTRVPTNWCWGTGTPAPLAPLPAAAPGSVPAGTPPPGADTGELRLLPGRE